jgi:thioredoxin-related protein
MRKMVVLGFFLFGFVVLGYSQEKVKWYSFEEAVALSKENPRKVFIDVYTDWCGWCKKLDQTTFNDPVIANILNNKYYAVKFNAESTKPIEFAGRTFVNKGNGRSTHQLAAALLQGKMSYPSAAYLTEDLQLLTSVAGYMKPKDLESILDFFATDSYKTVSYEDYLKSFEGKVKQNKYPLISLKLSGNFYFSGLKFTLSGNRTRGPS